MLETGGLERELKRGGLNRELEKALNRELEKGGLFRSWLVHPLLRELGSPPTRIRAALISQRGVSSQFSRGAFISPVSLGGSVSSAAGAAGGMGSGCRRISSGLPSISSASIFSCPSLLVISPSPVISPVISRLISKLIWRIKLKACSLKLVGVR
jgi:hypothetical protein|tara:strand:+ start:107 stop:571 length:465 start_codon:yes stop_codon:yes gene_type:complete